MSRRSSPRGLPCGFPASERGVVLLIALVVLVALTLAGTTLIRSVDTTNLIAGNLSFHQSAIFSGERSTELGLVNWLAAHNMTGDTALHADNTAQGYFATRQDPDPGVSWDTFWHKGKDGSGTNALKQFAVTEPNKDAAGNTVSYVIHRMCDGPGEPVITGTPQPGKLTTSCFQADIEDIGSSKSAGGLPLKASRMVFYRVTTRIQGLRNTVAYVQTFIAL